MEGLQLEEGDMPENNRNEIRVPVVEDEEKIALSICKKISSRASDFTIVGVAHNGEEALNMIGKFRPQVVFTDIAMPIMGGDGTGTENPEWKFQYYHCDFVRLF